jgi:hypothetical protein
MHHSHTLAVPIRRRTQRLIQLAVVVLAVALIVAAIVQQGGNEPVSVKVARSAPASPATVSRPDESGIAAAVVRGGQPSVDNGKSLSQIKRDAQYLHTR